MSGLVNGNYCRSLEVPPPAANPTQPSSCSKYAKYIGRVGALAFALGVGVAVATGSGIGLGAGVAYAQTEGDGTEGGGGQDADAGEDAGEGAGEDAGDAPGGLNPAEEPGGEQAGDGDGEPDEGSGNGTGVPENLNVSGDAQTKGQEEQGQDELGQGEGEDQGEGQDEGEGLTPSGTGGSTAGSVVPSGSGVPASSAPIVPWKPDPSAVTGSAGQNPIDSSGARIAGGENSMSLFSLNTDPSQSVQLTTATGPGTPAPFDQQLANPALGSVVAVLDIVTTAVATLVSAGPSKISSAQSICVQVVPDFGGVLITTSPGRNTNPSQRALSAVIER